MVKQFVIQEELTENEWVQCATAENEVIAYKIVKIRTRNEGKRFRIIDKKGKIYYTSETFGIKPLPKPNQESLQYYRDEFDQDSYPIDREGIEDKIEEMKDYGKSDEEIAKILMISPEIINKLHESRLRRMSLKERKNKKNQENNSSFNRPVKPPPPTRAQLQHRSQLSFEENTNNRSEEKIIKAPGFTENFGLSPVIFLGSLPAVRLSMGEPPFYKQYLEHLYRANAISKYLELHPKLSSQDREMLAHKKQQELLMSSQREMLWEGQCKAYGEALHHRRLRISSAQKRSSSKETPGNTIEPPGMRDLPIESKIEDNKNTEDRGVKEDRSGGKVKSKSEDKGKGCIGSILLLLISCFYLLFKIGNINSNNENISKIKPSNPPDIVGTLSRRGLPRLECASDYCFDVLTTIYYCPSGYVKVNDSFCRRSSIQSNLANNSWGLDKIASGIKEGIENLSKIKPPNPPENGDNSSAAYQWGDKEKELGDAPEFRGENYGYSLTPKDPSKGQYSFYNKLGCKGTEYEKTYRSWDRENEYKFVSGSEKCFSAMSAGYFSHISHLVGDCSRLRRETGFGRYKDVYKCTM